MQGSRRAFATRAARGSSGCLRHEAEATLLCCAVLCCAVLARLPRLAGLRRRRRSSGPRGGWRRWQRPTRCVIGGWTAKPGALCARLGRSGMASRKRLARGWPLGRGPGPAAQRLEAAAARPHDLVPCRGLCMRPVCASAGAVGRGGAAAAGGAAGVCARAQLRRGAAAGGGGSGGAAGGRALTQGNSRKFLHVGLCQPGRAVWALQVG